MCKKDAKKCTSPIGSIGSTYDLRGNRVGKTTPTEIITYTYDLANKLLSQTNVSGDVTEVTSYTYDLNGNLISRQCGTDTVTYTYTPLGMLASVTDSTAQTTTSYTYDGNNLRQTKTVTSPDGTSTTTKFIYDGTNLIAELVEDGDNKSYIYGIGIEAMSIGSKEYFFNKNILNDVEKVTRRGSDHLLQSSVYDAYGNKTIINGTELCPVGYRGEYQDAESGLIYLHNRYYDPSIGRFITEDTHWNIDNMIYGDKEYKDGERKIPDISAIMQSSNLSAYCVNNPIQYVDSSGDAVVIFSVTGSAGLGVGVETQLEIIVDDDLDWAVANSCSINCSVGISASVSAVLFPTINTVEEYVSSNSASLGVTVNGTGGAVVGATLKDGTEHIGISVSVGCGADVSIDGALSIASNILFENNYK